MGTYVNDKRHANSQMYKLQPLPPKRGKGKGMGANTPLHDVGSQHDVGAETRRRGP